MVTTPPADLASEARRVEDAMLAMRQGVWRRDPISSREVLETGMRASDFLCKLSTRIEKERSRDVITWLQETRRSMRAMLREYWTDVLEQRRAVYAPLPEVPAPAMIPVR